MRKILVALAFALVSLSALAANVNVSLKNQDAETAFGLMSQQNILSEFPTGEYGLIKELNCNFDRVAAAQSHSEPSSITCDGKTESGEFHIEGSQASKLMAVLSTVAQIQDFPGAEYVEVQSLTCNLDRLAQSAGKTGLSCEVELNQGR